MHICRFFTALALIPMVARADAPLLIDPEALPSVVQEGERIRIVTRNKQSVKGMAARITAEGVVLQTKNQETFIPVQDIDGFTVTRVTGEIGKRTWLPVILCSTIGTVSFLAAGATEERKSTYLPIAAAFTVGLGVGGYYAGRDWDRKDFSYRLRK